MFKLVLHISIAFAMLIQQLQMLLVCMVFFSQQPYLIRNVCINRHDPQTKCKAHCQLSKRINEQEPNRQQSKFVLKEEMDFIVGFEKRVIKVIKPAQKDPRAFWEDVTLLYGVYDELIDPPEIISYS